MDSTIPMMYRNIGSGKFRILRAGLFLFLIFSCFGTTLILVNLIITKIIGVICILFGLLCFWFYRNPKRLTNLDDNILTSPADGTVVQVSPENDEFTGSDSIRIGIFMTPLNVHVNRISFDGEVKDIIYTKGLFKPASFKDAPFVNERQEFLTERMASDSERFRLPVFLQNASFHL
jgi:phosphatidylserine decarboxylase